MTVRPTGHFGHVFTKATGYRLTRTFEIRSSRVAAIAAVAEHSSALLARGVPLAADAPQYTTLRKDVTAVVNVTFSLGR